ncbi:MAG: alpha/beta fold hydrolase [Roseovarius sp.]
MVKSLVFLAVLACVCAFVLVRASIRETQAETAFPPLGEIITINGNKVHAHVMGREAGTAPDVVLIHGSGGNLRDWTASIAPELAQDYRVILIDRPGHGFTDRINTTGATLQDQAQLLAATARHLGADQPIIVGHSFGGAVALAWAVHEPETLSAMVLLASPSNPWTTGVSRFYRLTSHPLTAPFLNPLITAFVSKTRVKSSIAGVFEPDAVPDGYLEEFGAALTLRREALRANALQRRNILPQIKALIPAYGQIMTPTEILHGTADDTVGLSIHSALLVDQIPNATLTPMQGIGHMPQHADPQTVITAIHRAATRARLR